MKIIMLTKGKFAIVDDDDFPYLSQFDWHAKKSRYTWYAARNIRSEKRKWFGCLSGQGCPPVECGQARREPGSGAVGWAPTAEFLPGTARTL